MKKYHLTKAERKAHKQQRQQRKIARGKYWANNYKGD